MENRGEYRMNGRIAVEEEMQLQPEPIEEVKTLSVHAPAPPPVSWLVKSWMPDATVSVLTGAGGAGKSRIALQLAAATAAGGAVFLPPTEIRKRTLSPRAPLLHEGDGRIVLFAAWETRVIAWKNRLAAIFGPLEGRAQRMAPMDGRLHYANMREWGGLWSAAGWMRGGLALLRTAERIGAGLLILDPVAAAFQSNENDRGQVRMFLSGLDQWAEENSCAILLISHPPKSGDPQSGSTDWRNGVQAVWELAPADKASPGGTRQLRVDKLNEGPLPDAVLLDYETGRFVEVDEAAGQEVSDAV